MLASESLRCCFQTAVTIMCKERFSKPLCTCAVNFTDFDSCSWACVTSWVFRFFPTGHMSPSMDHHEPGSQSGHHSPSPRNADPALLSPSNGLWVLFLQWRHLVKIRVRCETMWELIKVKESFAQHESPQLKLAGMKWRPHQWQKSSAGTYRDRWRICEIKLSVPRHSLAQEK